ncbi:MAG: N-6 DNA methylase [Streptococcus salivarius]|nr:N-6 DNA methylase [Streptococcus salivarius]
MFSDTERKSNGIYFTPAILVDVMTSYSIKLSSDSNIPDVLDPAVGSGIFLLNVAKKISESFQISITQVIENHLFGIDIIGDNTFLSKILLGTLAFEMENTVPKKFNIIQYNSLEISEEILNSLFSKSTFDIIISNPPYVSGERISSDTKQLLKRYSNTVYGNPDLYIPFFELTINLLKPSGIGALITPNSYFRSMNGKKLRSFLRAQTSSIRLINFNSDLVFDNISHYSAINFFVKKRDDTQKNKMFFLSNYNKGINLNNFNWLPISPSDSWHTLNQIEKNIIKKLENLSPTTLDDFKFQNGIATQRNNIFSFRYLREDEKYYYFEKKSNEYQIEKEITRPFVLPNKTFRDQKLRIIFPYYYNAHNESITPITPNEMLEKFPLALKYLNNFKDELSKRKYDKNMLYWYLYGRSQGLKQYGPRLYIPYMANTVNTSISSTDDEVFAAGYAIFSDSLITLSTIAKILESKLFSFYISRVSKPYSSGYFSTAKNMIKDFSIPDYKTFEGLNLEELTTESLYNLYKLNSEEIAYIETVC